MNSRKLFDAVPALAVIAALLSIQPLWGHRSDNGHILGAYSTRYALVLAVHIALSLGWGLVALLRERALCVLASLGCRLRYGGVVMALVLGAGVWFMPFEPHVKDYAAVNLLLVVALLTASDPARYRDHLGQRLLLGAAALLLIVLFFGVLVQFPFSPDEAHWADYATTLYVPNSFSPPGVYARTWLMTPYSIAPGVGWSVAAYGWALQNIAFDIRLGRIWNYASYLLSFGAIALLAWRLYGRRAALFAALFAVCSRVFIPVFDYRPDHQLAFAVPLVVFCTVQGRVRGHTGWHFAAGLLAALALQLHAAAVAVAFGLGLYYVASALLRREWKPLLAYGLGGLLGGAAYFALNVAPVGGLSVFLDILMRERGDRESFLRFLTWPLLPELVTIVGAFGFLIWRRAAMDRLFIGVLVAVAIGLALLDTQGYRSPVAGLYAVAVGAALAGAFDGGAGKRARVSLAPVCVLAGLLVFQAAGGVPWDDLISAGANGLPDYGYKTLGEALQPYLREDDIILGSHLLIWSLPRHPRLVSAAAEVTAMGRWNLSDPVDVWRRVQPTAAVIVENEVELNPGMRAYLEEQGFNECVRLQVATMNVTISRPDCSAGTET
jgi:hypothetical protein